MRRTQAVAELLSGFLDPPSDGAVDAEFNIIKPDEKKPVTKSDVGSEFYTTNELAAMLNFPRRAIEKWVLKKELPVLHCGRRLRFSRLEIQRRILSGNLLNSKRV